MALPKQILIPAGLGYGNSYYLRLRKKLKRTKLPMRRNEYILSEYNIQRRNKPGNPKRWGKVRKVRVEHNYNGYRYDLCCTLSHRGSNRHTFYSRIVALTLLTTGFGIRGRPLKRLRRIHTKALMKFYDVDHIHWNNYDCRLKALRIRPIHWHRSSDRLKWQDKKLTHHNKCKKVRAIWNRAVASGRVVLRPRSQ